MIVPTFYTLKKYNNNIISRHHRHRRKRDTHTFTVKKQSESKVNCTFYCFILHFIITMCVFLFCTAFYYYYYYTLLLHEFLHICITL